VSQAKAITKMPSGTPIASATRVTAPPKHGTGHQAKADPVHYPHDCGRS
jgi:hypothetical protein